MAYQNIHSHSPYLTLRIQGQHLYVKNLGPGIALNVSVGILNKNTHPKYEGEFFLLQTPKNSIDSLLNGEEKVYTYQYRKDLKATFTELVGDVEIGIKYSDKLLKNIYTTVVKISSVNSPFYDKQTKSIVKEWKIEG